jgi:hypothetical protein
MSGQSNPAGTKVAHLGCPEHLEARC